MMTKHFVLGTAMLSVAAGLAARTAQADQTGFELGGRIGYAIPLGDIAADDDDDLKDYVSGHVPIWLDIGGRVTPNIMVGGYLSVGPGFVGDRFSELVCDAADSCSVLTVRLGAELQYHISPFEDVDPWISAGLGFESTAWTVSEGDTDLRLAVSG